MFTKRVVSHLFSVLFILVFTLAQVAPAYAAGLWASTGSLATARYTHTATLLANGKVLVVGGYNGGPLSSAELYDPATGTWASTGALATARYVHTATLLANGQVLVVGGYGSGGVLSSAELYDPATGLWTSTGALATARYYHTATLLANGQVLVVGGYDSGGYLSSAELYDPGAGTWTSTGSLATARFYHTATLLANGQVLVVAGYGPSDPLLSSAELYDPGAGTWASTGSLTGARYGHTATLLANGQVLVVAGGDLNGPLSSAELYNPGAGTWTSSGSLTTARLSHTATLLTNGQVLVAGGYGSDGLLASAELYDPGAGTWTSTGSLATARYLHTATPLTNGQVLVVAGYGSGGPLAGAELYDAPTDTTAPTVTSFTATSPSTSLAIPITAFTASDDVSVTGYMITGSSTAPAPDDSGWSGAPPSTHTVGADGSYTLYPWARDAAGNVSALFGSSVSVTVDTTAPTVSMSSSATDPTNASPIAVTVTFSESVTGFTSGDITADNGTVGSFTGTGTSYSFDLTPSADGPVTADIAAGVAQDSAGNDNTAAPQFSRAYDGTAPTVAMTSLASNPTNASPIAVTVTFSESVTGFSSGDITTGNSTLSNFAGSGASYTFDLTPSANGLVTADIATGVAQDSAGNDNTAATQLSRAYDGTAPTVSMSSSAANPTNASPIPVTVTFSESVVGFTSGDVTATNATVGNFAGSGASYSFDLFLSTDGSVTVDIAAGVVQDAAGNTNTAAAHFSRAYDGTAPTVAMSSSATNPTNASPIAVTVTFSESVVGFTSGDITASNATVGSFTGSGAVYSFDLTPSANGPVTADIAAAVAQDAAGNTSTAAPQFSRTSDTTAPTVLMSSSAANPTHALPIPVTVTFSESVIGFTAGDITPGNATVGNFAGSGASYSFDLAPSANGPVTAAIAAGVAQDAAGNDNTAAAPFSRAYDGTAPAVTSIVRADPSPTSAASVDFTVTFSKSVSGVDTADFSLAATGVTGVSITGVTGSAATYTVTVNTGSGNGTLRLDLLDNDTILDATSNTLGGPGLGNGSFTTGEVYTINKIVPLTLTFNSTAVQDGWILETSETSGKGGTINAGANTLLLGDDSANRQYLAILSFSTGAALPDTAVITSVTLKVKKQAVLGSGNPLTIFQGFMVDIKKGLFGTAALQTTDFQAKASAKPYGPFKPAPVGGWYSLDLTGASSNINRLGTLTNGLTQIRLRFKLDDNNNALANTLSLFSGNAPAASRPQLIITYYVP